MKTQIVAHIAKLANIPITPQKEEKLAAAFEETLSVIANLKQVNVSGVEPTHQVTGMTNMLRDDVVDEERMFSQAEALMNAKDTYDGYIVVEQILDQE